MKMSFPNISEYYDTCLSVKEHRYEHERWFSTPEREAAYRMTRDAVLRHVIPHVREGVRILEVGAGPGTWTKELLSAAQRVSVDIVDISDEMLAQAKSVLGEHGNVTYTRADFASWNPQKTYDMFFSSRAIEYMPDKANIFRTIRNVLKEGGVGCIITKYPHYVRAKLKGGKIRDVHALQVSPRTLKKLCHAEGLRTMCVAPVTFVFPTLHKPALDLLLHKLFSRLPLWLSQPFVESYTIVFTKK